MTPTLPFLVITLLTGAHFAAEPVEDWIRLHSLACNTSVAKELGLSDEQLTQLRDTRDKMLRHTLDEYEATLGMTTVERAEARLALLKADNQAFQKALSEALKPEQLKRLKQVLLQERGPLAVANTKIAEPLRLTAEQIDKLKELKAEAQKARLEASAKRRAEGGTLADYRKKVEEINKQAAEKAIEVFDEKQKTIWKELTGEPFEITPELRPTPAPAN